MKITKKHIFGLGLSAMLLPLFLSYFPINNAPFEVLKLSNSPKIEEPRFDWEAFFSDTLVSHDTVIVNSLAQKDKLIATHTENVEKHLNQKFGLSPLYIRLRNQLDYSLFGQPHANSVIVGKDGYLYEEQYIKSYYGEDFIGQDSIDTKVEKLKFIQKELEKQGKLVFVVIAPGKGTFYPEFIPEKYKTTQKTTNYQGYVKAFKKNNINYIDFNKHFLKLKKQTNNDPVLYPKTGIHWSQYAMYNALDSILTYIEKDRNYELTRFSLIEKEKSTDTRFKDNDIEQGLNLFFELDHLKMSYPVFNFDEPKGQVKPTMLTISDSFYWQMYNLGISHQIFNEGKFWFYNQTVHPESDNGSSFTTNRINLFEELQKREIVMLMATEANLHKFSFGFIEEAHETLVTGIEAYNKRINEIIEQIKATPDWYADVQFKAEEKGVTLDEMLLMDAQYVYRTEIQKK